MNDACRLTTLKVLNVLIDTWWNVNIHKGDVSKGTANVLIDTWWNVNFAYYRFIDAVLTVLIDTWWNVN